MLYHISQYSLDSVSDKRHFISSLSYLKLTVTDSRGLLEQDMSRRQVSTSYNKFCDLINISKSTA